jgi:hypothetical protein
LPLQCAHFIATAFHFIAAKVAMSDQSCVLRIKRKTLSYFAAILLALVSVTPVLADYLGPNRTKTETSTACKVVLYECEYVAAKDIWKYKSTDSWACSNESKPWRDYPSNSHTCNDNLHDAGYQYWEREDSSETVTNTYPPATINGSLQNCALQNGWCVNTPQLSLSADEPVLGYNIIAVEGTLNGQNFACANSSCSVPLNEGDNNFTYWALSSWGDSSVMGTLNAKVDSQLPTITGTFTGASGSNGWYLSPISFNGSAFDVTSGLATFTCTLDGAPLGSCTAITVNNEGIHTLVLTARDNAGNTRTLTQNTSVDTQTPILGAALNGTLGSNNWYTSAKLNASASDATPGSGLSSFEYNLDNGSWISFPGSGELNLPDGKHSIDMRAMDNAGHTALASKPFWLDSVAPAVMLDLIGLPGANNWYITEPNVTASASDDTSGLDIFDYSLDNNSWTAYGAPLTISDGLHNLSFWAQDSAGLVTQVDRTYKVDTQAPRIAGSLSGIPGTNGWYTSDVTLSASASDPTPGSSLDTFTYILDGSTPTTYTNDLILSDGEHTVELSAQDKAGLTYSMQQSVKVDTTYPSLNIQTTLPNWIKESVILTGTSEDKGSGLSKVEISIDGGQTWQSVTGLTSWSYTWDTTKSSNGMHEMIVRVIDNAGLTTKQTLTAGVDNRGPKISLPDSWYQWDTVTVDVWDNLSGLSRAYIEISDPEERWPKRVISLDPKNFPLEFKWDRRFGDETIAPLGTYDLKVIAFDHLDNIARQGASIKILLSILPAGPTSTPQPYSRDEFTETSSYASTQAPAPIATQSAVVSTFGIAAQETIPATPISETIAFPRAAPSQTSVMDWLQSIFTLNTNEENVIEIGTSEEMQDPLHSAPDANGSLLWGAAATAMIGAVTAYAYEERRKQEEEKARQATLEAEEEERKEKKKARKMKKMEEKRVQEQAWEEARQEAQREEIEAAYHIQNDIKMERIEVEEEKRRIASEMEAKREAQEKKKAEELKEGLAAYYNATRQGQIITETPPEKTFWQKSVDWIDDHQAEIALGFGVVAGVGAILLSGGLATPLVAAAWTAGAAAVAISAAAVGTVALNAHYGRDWNTNLVKNVALAGGAAAVVTGGWFLLQSATTLVGAYCARNTTCSHIEPVLNTLDTAEETWLTAKLAYQTWRHDPAAVDTALELQMEHLDGGMPGNSVAKELDQELAGLSDDALRLIEQHGDDILPLLLKYQDDAVDIINAYGDEGVAILQKYGDDAIGLVKQYGTPAVKVITSVGPEAAETLLKTLDDDVLDYAIKEGPEAVEALSLWSANELETHGAELALRAKKDAKVLSDVKKLIALGPIDPKHLTDEQRVLIDAIAANSTQYADEGQVVLGKWVDISNGFVETAKDTGSVHYNPHPEMWNLLGGLGQENQGEVAWLINQQVVQTGINQGLPFEFTLNGVPANSVKNEITAIQAIFSGKTSTEITRILKSESMPIRMREIQELQKAGYEFIFDEVNNSYIFSLP